MKNTKVELYQVVEAILLRLNRGCQWRQLPMKQFFSSEVSMAKRLPPPSEMLQRWDLGTCLAISTE